MWLSGKGQSTMSRTAIATAAASHSTGTRATAGWTTATAPMHSKGACTYQAPIGRSSRTRAASVSAVATPGASAGRHQLRADVMAVLPKDDRRDAETIDGDVVTPHRDAD